MNLNDISYLARGTPSQRRVFQNISELGILERLAPFHATLAATFCIDLDIEGSDLDVICEVHEGGSFMSLLHDLYGKFPEYALTYQESPRLRIVAKFRFKDFVYEVFAEPVPVTAQNGYRHLMQNNRVVTMGGPTLRAHIRALKRSGIKTEPAIAKCLGLAGEPYQAVLALEQLSDDELLNRIRMAQLTLSSEFSEPRPDDPE